MKAVGAKWKIALLMLSLELTASGFALFSCGLSCGDNPCIEIAPHFQNIKISFADPTIEVVEEICISSSGLEHITHVDVGLLRKPSSFVAWKPLAGSDRCAR